MRKRTSIKNIIVSVKQMYGETDDMMLEQSARIFCARHLDKEMYSLTARVYKPTKDDFL